MILQCKFKIKYILCVCVCVCIKTFQLRLTLCNPMDCSVLIGAPLSMGFSRREYWSVFPCPSPGDLPDPGIKRPSFTSPVLAGGVLYH